ncbi:MAG: lysophospholipid acyltransferase family protein [Spirochaetia bacterium]|nr:lysophospholipid acyltransferase family protein [Spirochaetia bacterium]
MKPNSDFSYIEKLFSGNSYITGSAQGKKSGSDSKTTGKPAASSDTVTGNGVNTGAGLSSSIGKKEERLSFLKAAAFYIRFLNVILSARRKVLKGRYTPQELIKSGYTVLKSVEKAGGKIVINGLDNLRACKGPAVIVANHMSTLETGMFPCVIGIIKDATFVVKRSLITNYLFGPVMKYLDPIDVERKEPRKDLERVLSKGTELIASGRSVIIFPQASRRSVFDPEKFNSLGIKLAKKAGVPVIPAALKTDLWENGKTFSTMGYIYPERTVHVDFGEAVTIEGAGKKEHEKTIDFIKSRFKTWEKE